MGLLDGLFAPNQDAPNPALFKLGSLGETAGEDVPMVDDYTGSVPTRREKKPAEALDEDLKKFRETHPLTPQAAAAAAPPMPGAGAPVPAVGMLSPELGGPYGAIPNSSGPGPYDNAQWPSGPQGAPQVNPKPSPMDNAAWPVGPVGAPGSAPAAPVTPASTDLSSQSVKGSPAEGAIDMTDAPVGMLSKVWDGIKGNSNLLMGMGAGMVGAPSWATGMSRGFAGAQAGSAQDQKLNLQTTSAQQTATALLKAGAPRAQVMASMNNPIMQKALIDQYVTGQKGELKNIKLANGTEISVLHNPYDGTVKTLDGRPLDMNNISSSIIDPNLTGEAARTAAEKADPALLRQAMNYVSGQEMLPASRALTNPRLKAAMDLARQIDPELTDNVSQARTSYMKDVGNTKNGVGFQIKGFDQGAEHLYKMAQAIEKYGPSNGMGSADIAHVVNSTKQRFGTASGLARQIAAEGSATAGEIGKLFSGQAGGGVHEREATSGRFATGNGSATELAGALDGTADLMEGGISSIEKNRDRVMGEHGSKLPQVQFRNADTQAKIDAVRAIARRLRGEDPPAAAPASGVAGPKKVQWSVVQP